MNLLRWHQKERLFEGAFRVQSHFFVFIMRHCELWFWNIQYIRHEYLSMNKVWCCRHIIMVKSDLMMWIHQSIDRLNGRKKKHAQVSIPPSLHPFFCGWRTTINYCSSQNTTLQNWRLRFAFLLFFASRNWRKLHFRNSFIAPQVFKKLFLIYWHLLFSFSTYLNIDHHRHTSFVSSFTNLLFKFPRTVLKWDEFALFKLLCIMYTII